MKCKVLLTICAVCVSAPLSAQQMVPIDILGLYGQVPPPPTTTQEAYARAGCTVNGGCDTNTFYDPIEARFAGVDQRLQLALSAYAHQAQPSNALQSMSPAELQEFQKKLESMSQAERIAFATAMSKAENGALAPEPAAVQAALAEVRAIRSRVGLQASAATPAFADRFQALRSAADREHDAAARHASDDRFKDSQGMPGPDWDQAQRDAMDMHLAVEQDFQQAVLIAFREELTRQKARFAVFQQKLAEAGYGEGAVNAMSKSDLLSTQRMMLHAAGRLLAASRRVTEQGAHWWTAKLEQERNLR